MYGANCDSALMTVIDIALMTVIESALMTVIDSALMTVIDSALMTIIQIWKNFIKIVHYLLDIILGRTLIQNYEISMISALQYGSEHEL